MDVGLVEMKAHRGVFKDFLGFLELSKNLSGFEA
jgi:hypothetical protein